MTSLSETVQIAPVPQKADAKRIAKFLMVGVSGVLVNQVVVWVASASMRNELALGLGIVISILTNFLINDRWTWGDRSKADGFTGWYKRCGAYYLTNGIGACLQYGIAWAAASFIHLQWAPFGLSAERLSVQLASIVGILVATPLNYVLNNFWTFRDRQD